MTKEPKEIKPGDTFTANVTCDIDFQGYPRLYKDGKRVHNFDEEIIKGLFPNVAKYLRSFLKG